MTIIPGWVMAIWTFPGRVVHTASLRLFCDLLEIPVYQVGYLRGTLSHGRIATLRQAALICFGPLIVNTLLCAVLMFPLLFPLMLKDEQATSGILFGVLAWGGMTIGMHAFPTPSEVAHFLQAYDDAQRTLFVRIAGSGLKAIVLIVDKLRFFWIDLIYAALVGVVLPQLVIRYVLR